MAADEDESVLNKISHLRLTEEEDSAVQIDGDEEEPTELKFAVVAKILTSKVLNHKALVNTLAEVWRKMKIIKDGAMTYKVLGSHIILFSFADQSDMRRVLEGGPWRYRNFPIVFACYDSLIKLQDIRFQFIPVWVRVYDLPLGLRSAKVINSLGDLWGGVVKADTEADGFGGGEFLRLRDNLDISKPLRRGVFLKTPRSTNPKGTWFDVKYENLPHFCFYCGLLGDGCRCESCVLPGTDKQYDESLRAPMGNWGVEIEKLHRVGQKGGSFQKEQTDEEGLKVGDSNKKGSDSLEKDVFCSKTASQGSSLSAPVMREKIPEYTTEISSPPMQTEAEVEVRMDAEMEEIGRQRGVRDKPAEHNTGEGDVTKAKQKKSHERKSEGGEKKGDESLTLEIRNNRGKRGVAGNRILAVFEKKKGGPQAGMAKKRDREEPTKTLALTMGEENFSEEEGETGPKQKRKKEVLLSELEQNIDAGSAVSASQQHRQAQ